MNNQQSILKIEDLQVHFPIKAGLMQRTVGVIRAVDGVSIDINRGETVGLVGESGCGKTTIGRAIVRLNEPTAGKIIFDGKDDILQLKGNELRQLRKKLQIIFQDPYSSLNPRQTVKRLLSEVLTVQMGMTNDQAFEKAAELLNAVGLSPVYAQRYPHEFSGGQRQRVGIARAIALHPEFVVCDEPVSALDVSIQAQVINLMQDIKKEYQLTYLFISHDLRIIKHFCDRVMVMYLGNIVELGTKEAIYGNQRHPYTKALLSAVSNVKGHGSKNRIILQGDIPSPVNPPSGCPFHTRCSYCMDICREKKPELKKMADGTLVACHLDME